MLTRIQWRVSFLTLAGLWAASELALRCASPLIWAALPHNEPLSRALFADRLRTVAAQRQGKKLCVALGDSVFYGSAMREKGLAHWPDQTPTACLRRSLGPGWVLLDLSADGVEPMDLLAMLHAAAPLKPDTVVLELNIRMLAKDAGDWPGCMSRPWLWDWMPADTGLPPPPARQDFEKRAFARMQEGLTRVSAVARYAELAHALLFQPTAKDVYAGEVKSWMPGDQELDPDLLLDMKIRPYYDAPAADPAHLGLRSLAPLAREIQSLHAAQLVFLTPQNLARVAEFLNPAGFKRNRAQLLEPFRAAGLRSVDLAEAMPAPRFLDHCHLDPLGNQQLAEKILEELKP